MHMRRHTDAYMARIKTVRRHLAVAFVVGLLVTVLVTYFC